VVGAMGDSLVAGNGALEEFAMGTLIEYRGVSWAAGTAWIRFEYNVYIIYFYSFLTRRLFDHFEHFGGEGGYGWF